MTRLDPKKETCPCPVCRSDLAYLVPCELEDTIEFTLIDPSKGLEKRGNQQWLKS